MCIPNWLTFNYVAAIEHTTYKLQSTRTHIANYTTCTTYTTGTYTYTTGAYTTCTHVHTLAHHLYTTHRPHRGDILQMRWPTGLKRTIHPAGYWHLLEAETAHQKGRRPGNEEEEKGGSGVEGERMWCGGREDVVWRERGCGVEGERMWCGREIHLPGSSSFSSLCPSATWRWWPEAVGRLLSVSHQARMGIIECKKNTLIIIQYTVQVCSMHTCIKTCT